MIQIPRPWEGDRAEALWAVYYFLLYKTLPFEPKDYLPKDQNGFYYYKNGDRTKEKVYPDAPAKTMKITKGWKKKLSKAAIPIPNTLEELIELVSPQLHDYLYQKGAVRREHLIRLLTTQTDGQTIQAHHLEFAADPDWVQLLLTTVFPYARFSRKPLFAKLVQLMGVEVCPYCNRSFTTTAKGRNGSYHRQNQVDHYRSKSKYPWFAVTLPNLVPACGNCNLRKGDDDDSVLYPYLEGFGARYQFHTTLKSAAGYLMGDMVSPDDFAVEIQRDPAAGPVSDPDYEKRVQTSIRKFGLDVLYRQSHNAYVCDIFEQRYIFSDAYLDALMDSFPDLFESREEARRLLYMKRYDADALGASPLAKLTHDIDREISRLNGEKEP